mgnify:CR=1 FL=1
MIEKRFINTRIIAITEPNFGELYSGMSGSDHRLYQEVALGFGGYAALKLLGLFKKEETIVETEGTVTLPTVPVENITDENNEPITNETIKIEIDGEIIEKKTNEQGNVNFKMTDLKLGQYVANVFSQMENIPNPVEKQQFL